LLPQAGGFEGGCPVVAEVLHLDQLAIAAERPEGRDIWLELGTARLPLRAEADERDHLISCVDQLLRFPRRPSVPCFCAGLMHDEIDRFVAPSEDEWIYKSPRKVSDEVRAAQPRDDITVPAAQSG